MAWSAPRTWTTAEIVTASHMNTDVRDNLLETAPALVSAANRFVISDAANSLVERAFNQDIVATTETTTSTSFTDLATAGPAITVTTGTQVLLILSALVFNATGGSHCQMGFAVSGATSTSPDTSRSFDYESSNAGDILHASFVYSHTGLTAGSNTFTAKYRTFGAGTASFASRRLMIFPLS